MREAPLSRVECDSDYRTQTSSKVLGQLGGEQDEVGIRTLGWVGVPFRVVLICFCALSFVATRYAIGAEQQVATTVPKGEACAALPYARLSAKIYEHKEAGDSSTLQIGEWKRMESYRGAAGPEACKNAQDLESNLQHGTVPGLSPALSLELAMQARSDDDPISFHAEVYQGPGGKLAVVFEGTTLTAVKDWLANLGSVVIESSQHKAGLCFADWVEDQCKAGELSCKGGVVYTGHSLGGGIAQYVAARKGGIAYVFNAAGLWGGTTKNVDREVASGASVHLFYAVAERNGKFLGRDLISKTGVQFMSAGRTFEVPIALPERISDAMLHGLDDPNPITVVIMGVATPVSSVLLHSKDRLVEGLGAICSPSEPAEQPEPTTVPEGEACAALPYARLSAQIYDHKKAGDNSTLEIGEWTRVESYRAAAGPEACKNAQDIASSLQHGTVAGSTPALSSEFAKSVCDPFSFHAEAYQGPGGRLAVVFEGTTFTSGKDWLADIKAFSSADSAQYEQGIRFADKIEKKCGKGLSCEGGVIYTGHSLGGGIAQYVVVSAGGTADVFNGVGLWGKRIENIDASVESRKRIARVRLFYSVAEENGEVFDRDVVSELGVQFMSAGRTFEVPITLPELNRDARSYGYDPSMQLAVHMQHAAGQALALHSVDRLVEGLRAACSPSEPVEGRTATSLIIDSSGSMIGYVAGSMGTVVRSTNKADLRKLDRAKEAAKSFISSRSDDEWISISTFSDSGSTQLPLTSVSEAKDGIDSVLGGIRAAGGTNIGAGVEQGFEQLSNAGSTGDKMAILLSDGANTTGDWRAAVQKFKDRGWPICTVGFGTDADENTLRGIAEDTGCVYEYADVVDVVNKYQSLSAYAEGKSTVLSVTEAIPADGMASFPFHVGAVGATHANSTVTMLDVFSSWQGSNLSVELTSPDGRTIDGETVSRGYGRYEEGDTFQMLQIQSPPPGRWKVAVSWSEPPTKTEQVNLLIVEKSDVFGRIHGFHSEYSSGQPVSIQVDADELLGTQKVPLLDTSVSVKVQKPGAQMVQMVQAQSTNWVMYKDVLADVIREVVVYDDGNHGDYRIGDGIWAGTFRETDNNGSYLVTAIITGTKRDGTPVKKTLLASFQVGPIEENQITTSQTLQYVEQAKLHVDSTTPYSKEIIQQPANKLEQIQGDAGNNIDRLLR